MANENFIEKLAAGFNGSASVKNVYGEPVQVGDKTIIPVACIAYGMGGGFGQGPKPGKMGTQEREPGQPAPVGEGAGGGGGMYAKAKGVFEITPKLTRFIPVNGAREILMGVAIGFLIKAFFFSRKRCR